MLPFIPLCQHTISWEWAPAFPLQPCFFQIYPWEKAGCDDTQQALAFSAMIKMFINTGPSRWWNLSHTPAGPTWKPRHHRIQHTNMAPAHWPPGPTCDKQYDPPPLRCQINKHVSGINCGHCGPPREEWMKVRHTSRTGKQGQCGGLGADRINNQTSGGGKGDMVRSGLLKCMWIV